MAHERGHEAITRDPDLRGRHERAGAHAHDEGSGHVRGRVVLFNGRPAEQAEVLVLARRLRCADAALGKAVTDAEGRYAVAYALDGPRVDLYVRATRGNDTVASPLVIDAGGDEVIDLVLGGAYLGRSDLEHVEEAVGEILTQECGGTDVLATLDEGEVALLAGKSGVEPADVVLLRQAAALAAETKLSTAVFYALGRQRVPLALAAVLATDPTRRREAVEDALESNQVPGQLHDQLDADLRRLEQMSLSEALRKPRLPGQSTLGTLLEAAGMSQAQRTYLATTYAQHAGTTPELWKVVRESGQLSAEEVDRVQDALRLAAITLNHVPLVEALHARRLRRPSELAQLEKDDWRALIDAAGMPPDLAASGLDAHAYADLVYGIVEDVAPTARLMARVEHLPAPTELRQFLVANPEFEIRATPVAAFLRGKPEALDHLPDDEARATFTRQLKRIERVYRIAPPGARLETMEVLLGDGVASAHRIRSQGRAAFVRRYGKQLGAEVAERTYARASHAAAAAAILVARHAATFDRTAMAVLPARAEALTRFPDYQTLFGSFGFCACAHCQSVYSPAAYLTDVLHWLDGRAAVSGTGSALDVLLDPGRRGDLGRIELSCPNTHTPLPYIDLVNELLELAVAPPEMPPAYQTRGTAEDLRIQPEHRHDDAYAVLADAVYPFDLPFDVGLTEARTYLGHLGVPRHALLEALHAGGREAALADPAVAAEALGLTALEWDVIAGKPLDPPRPPEAFWGVTGDPDWIDTLATIAKLLARATPPVSERAMTYEELADVLRTDFVQAPGHEVGVWFEGSACDPARGRLVGLGADHLDRIHRFLRLQRRLGWTAAQLDRAIAVVGGGVLDEACLLSLARVRRLETELAGVDRTDLFTWWGLLDTRRWAGRLRMSRPAGIPDDAPGVGFVFTRTLAPAAERGEDQSPYDLRFASRSVGTAPDPAFHIGADGQALLDETGELAAVAPAVAAALGVTEPQLAAVMVTASDDRLSLANLSHLARHVSLAGALGLAIHELVSIVDLSEIDPFAAPSATLAFVREVGAVRASGLTVDELAYLLRHRDTRPPTLAPAEARLGVLLLQLADTLRAARADHPEEPARGIAMRGAVIDQLAAAFGVEPAVAAALLERHVRHPDDATRSAIEAFLDPAVVDHAATDPDTGAPRPPGPADLPAAFAALARLHKVTLLVTRWRITADELVWVCELVPATGALDVNDLPISAEGAPAPYAAWARLRDAVRLRDRMSGGRLFDLFEAAHAAAGGDADAIAAAHEALLAELARRTRWTPADLEHVVGVPARDGQPPRPGALGLVYPADWRDERALARVNDALQAIQRIGLAAETVWPWREIPAAAAQAQAIQQAARARHDDAAWRAIAAPLRDALRGRQRDALVGWLLAHDGRFVDARDVYAHFLLDVEMSPCQLTSRLRLAMSSVQSFVQRALMNLEPAIELTVDDAREWAWMKTYRVWEANRKIFLYPENWLEPELRDDKTPLYRELENELLQGEVTDESATRALTGYLDRLDEIARLEVVATCRQRTDGGELLHVFGRTRNTPPRTYHRQRTAVGRWTPWEPMEVDIEGDHLVPVVYRDRLYVFWTQITDAAIEEKVGTPRAAGHTTAREPERYYQLRLAWSECRDGAWRGRKLSTVQIGATVADYRRLSCALRKSTVSRSSDFFFRVWEDADDLVVEPIRYVRAASKKRSSFYVRLDRFRLSGCDGTMTLDPRTDSRQVPIRLPAGTEIVNQRFASTGRPDGVRLPARDPDSSAYLMQHTLGWTDGAFGVVPTQVDDFHSQDAFFVQDLRRTFFVEPRDVYRPTRHVPDWVGGVDAIALDPARLYAETGRPAVTRPDPWLVDVHSILRDAAAIDVVAPPELIGAGGGRVAGLPALGAAGLADTFGSRVGYVGGEAVEPRPDPIAVLGRTELVSRAGKTLLGVTTAGAPADAIALRRLTMETSYVVPDVMVADVFHGPALTGWAGKRYRFEAFYHPYVCAMLRQLGRYGVDGLLDPPPTPGAGLRRQQLSDFFFEAYAPRAVDPPYPRDHFDFSYGGAYAPYNWEVFFHVPFAIACGLSANQQFAEAQRWFHYLFDPTEADGRLPAPQRFWKVRPLFELFWGEDVEAGPIHELLLLLHDDGADPDRRDARDRLLAQIAEWRAHPFQPHAIARLRLGAYQKAVVKKYVDNLIAWGDHLFRQDTLESVNEATQLYVLAAQILGPRPQEVKVEPPPPRTFDEIRALGLDAFGNALLEEVEGYLPDLGEPPPDDSEAPVVGPTLLFCVPPNDTLVRDTWDRVEDRLFKLRHCMNIEGVVRQLPLFEPPLDPALLVRAAAAGIDLGSALREVDAPLPLHRYAVMSQKASELCSEVRALGNALLGALEKKDGEALALLRAGHEVKLLGAMRQVRQRQIAEARETVAGLRRSQEGAQVRVDYYRSRSFMNAAEKAHLALSAIAAGLDVAATVVQALGSAASWIPTFQTGAAGFGGSPFATVEIGGKQGHDAAKSTADQLQTLARLSDRAASLAAVVGGHQRRRDDWVLQGDVAAKDVEALDRQIVAAQIRVAIAERELANLDLQIEQARQAEDLLRSKFTSDQLYAWMAGQLSSLYFQGYQLAYEVAKRAERAWQFELAAPETSFVRFGYWDSLKKGLLAGEQLAHDLRRMEVGYLDGHRREYELIRHVSVRHLDPVALLQLRTEGACLVRIPETWFDLDHPGHYLRRIKTVAISLPTVTGEYVTVPCTLTLLASTVRHTASVEGSYPRTGPDDPRFRDDPVAIHSIVTSSAQEDAGLFETNLRDERYLPFEGAGAISEWRIELPTHVRPFDYAQIGNAVLHVRYTARDGGAALRSAAGSALVAALPPQALLVSLTGERHDEWRAFLSPPADQTDQVLPLALPPSLLPYGFRQHGIRVTGVDLILRVKDVAGYGGGAPVRLQVTPPGGAPRAVELTSAAGVFDGMPHGAITWAAPQGLGDWSIAFVEADNAGASPTVVTEVDGHRRLDADAIDDLLVAIHYRVEEA
jgi:hypothetical protein